MVKSFVWMLYVTAYTLLLGLPLLLFPNAVLPLIGFNTTEEPWVRLVGGLLALSYITLTIYRKQIRDMLIPSAGVRSGIIAVLVTLGYTGGHPFFYVVAAIMLIGVLGTFASYRA